MIETYYIVECLNREVKAYDGSVLTKENSVTYLSTDSGYYSHTRESKYAEKFKTPPTREVVAQYDGMPWYNRIKSHRVIKVTEEKIFNQTMEYV